MRNSPVARRWANAARPGCSDRATAQDRPAAWRRSRQDDPALRRSLHRVSREGRIDLWFDRPASATGLPEPVAAKATDASRRLDRLGAVGTCLAQSLPSLRRFPDPDNTETKAAQRCWVGRGSTDSPECITRRVPVPQIPGTSGPHGKHAAAYRVSGFVQLARGPEEQDRRRRDEPEGRYLSAELQRIS